MLLGTLAASLLGNNLTGRGDLVKSVSKETKSKRQGRGINRADEDLVRAGYGKKLIFNAASDFD